jgi:hypothetical protein
MHTGWSPKRERQFEHVMASYLDRGSNPSKAAELAARLVNRQQRARGETRTVIAAKVTTRRDR